MKGKKNILCKTHPGIIEKNLVGRREGGAISVVQKHSKSTVNPKIEEKNGLCDP